MLTSLGRLGARLNIGNMAARSHGKNATLTCGRCNDDHGTDPGLNQEGQV